MVKSVERKGNIVHKQKRKIIWVYKKGREREKKKEETNK